MAGDAEWVALCGAMGRPELAADERFATMRARLSRQDELDELIGTWTRHEDRKQLMHGLQAAGVAAQAVYTIADLVQDDHVRSRGIIETVPGPASFTSGADLSMNALNAAKSRA